MADEKAQMFEAAWAEQSGSFKTEMDKIMHLARAMFTAGRVSFKTEALAAIEECPECEEYGAVEAIEP